jgi:MFS family permease
MSTPPGPHVLRSDTVSIATAIALIGLVGIGLSLSLPLLSLEMARMGVSSGGIGVSTAFSGMAAILTVPFVPRIAARLGLGPVIALALLLSVVSLVLFYIVMNFWAWLLFRVMLSIGLGTLFVLSEYWITSTAPRERRGMVMGIYATILALGFAAGPAILAIVGTSGPMPYFTGAALFACAGLPLWYARRWLPPLDSAPQHSIGRYLLAVPLASVAGFASGAIETGGIALLPVFGLHQGFGATQAALLVSCVALGNVISQVPIGLLSDRVSKAWLLCAIGALGGLATLAIPFAATAGPYLLYPLLFAWGGIAGGLYTVGLAHLASQYSGAELAGGNAAFVVLFNVGPLVGPPLVGSAMDVSRSYGFAAGMAVFFALVVAVYVSQVRQRRSL